MALELGVWRRERDSDIIKVVQFSMPVFKEREIIEVQINKRISW